MILSYKKLWKLLIDRSMKKGELRDKTKISQATMAKLAKNENVTTDILVRICKVLNCGIEDIAEIQHDANENTAGNN